MAPYGVAKRVSTLARSSVYRCITFGESPIKMVSSPLDA